MPGGWTMSMTWMRMPGQTWAAVAASFLGMWVVMTAVMMSAALLPMLLRYHRAVGGTCHAPRGWLTAVVGAGYLIVWVAFGAVIFPLGAGLAALEMRLPQLARAVPMATGVLVVCLGALQLTRWKARRLACCRRSCGKLAPRVATAWQHGLRIGLQCSTCCANLMAIPLVLGIMDLRVMGISMVAITVERLAPAGERVARAAGLVLIGGGLCMLLRAVSAG